MTKPLINQPTAFPTRKLMFGTVGSGTLTPIIVTAAAALGFPLPAEAAGAIGTLLFAVFGYFTRDRARPDFIEPRRDKPPGPPTYSAPPPGYMNRQPGVSQKRPKS